MVSTGVNHDALARARQQLGETSRRNAVAASSATEARHHLDVAAAIDPGHYNVTIDLSDGRRFPLGLKAACLADAVVRAIQTYVPADATELIVSVDAARVFTTIPEEACIA